MQSSSHKRRTRRDDAASSKKLDRTKRKDVEKFNECGDAPVNRLSYDVEPEKHKYEEWQLDQEGSSGWPVEFEEPSYYKYKGVGKEEPKEREEGKDQKLAEDCVNVTSSGTKSNLLNEGDINIEDFDVDDLEDDDDDDVEVELDPDYDAEELEDEDEEEDIDEGAFLGECEFAEAQVMTERYDDVSDKSVGDPKDSYSNIYFWTYALIGGLFLAFTLYLTFNILPAEMQITKEEMPMKQNEIGE